MSTVIEVSMFMQWRILAHKAQSVNFFIVPSYSTPSHSTGEEVTVDHCLQDS